MNIAKLSLSPIGALITAGITLQLASVSGMYAGLSHYSFFILWLTHIGALSLAAVLSLKEIIRFAQTSLTPKSSWLLLTCCALCWTAALILGFLPITARDALIHHLAVPKWWINEGLITPTSWHDWSFYPMLLQTSFAGLMQAGGLSLTPLYHLLYAIILAGLSGKLASDLGGERHRLPAVFLCASLPVVIKLSTVPLVDLGLAVYCLAALILVVKWFERPDWITSLSAGAAVGLALSTKPNALLFVAVLVPWIAATTARVAMSERARIKPLIIGAIVAIIAATAVFSPWPIQNAALTGNPIYPLAQSVVGLSQVTTLDQDKPRKLSPLETRRLLHGESWAQIALLPIRIFIEGQDDNPKLFDGRLSPLLLFAFVLLFLSPKSRGLTFVLGSCLSYLAVALLLTDTRVRYLAPIFGPLCALASLGIMRATDGKRHAPLLLALLAFAQMVWAGIYLAGLVRHVRAIEFFSGKYSREEYLTRAVPEYTLAREMAKSLDSNSKTYLVLTGNRFFYFDTPVESAGHTSAAQLLAWVNAAQTPEELASTLRAQGFTNLLVHMPRLTKLVEVSLSSSKQKLLKEFFNSSLMRLSERRGTVLFSLNPSFEPQ